MSKRIITQIYEIQTASEAEKMIELGVDHIGSVILSAADWKQPAIKEAVALSSQTASKSSLIMLYHDQDLIFRSLDYYRPHIVHFCETLFDPCKKNLDEKQIETCLALQAAIRERFPEIRIMRSIPIPLAGKADGFPILELADLFEPMSDYFLTDTLIVSQSYQSEQPVQGFVGITGKTCDWNMAANLVRKTRIPLILAGGLSAENVYQGIISVNPAGVDSCTLTNALNESGCPVRFQKDLEKVSIFVGETRRAERETA